MPSAAWAIEIGTSVTRSSSIAAEAIVRPHPEVHVEIAGWHRRAGRPAPRRVSRSVEPSTTPAGTSTVYVLSAVIRPSPRHFAHGVVITSPRPPHRGHGLVDTIWPSTLWRTRRTWPDAAAVGST